MSPQQADVAAFFGPQVHIATEHFGSSDPLDLDEYLARGGFTALRRCLETMQPGDVVEEVRQSGLRGRAAPVFPRGPNGASCVRPRAAKYVICNGDEGDPGAFMDRMLMESFPYRIIEGMSIAAYAVGAAKAIVYVRAEYPFAVQRMREAIDRLRHRGLPGNSRRAIAWSWNSTSSRRGAFVCGEETALLESIEGRRGIPRLRPPYPAQSGLYHCPTLINNVETYANVPWIFRNGAAAFARYGTARARAQGLRPGGQDGPRRADRGADGHHHPPRCRRHRRRDRRRPPLQGRAHRRPVRRLPARIADRHADRLRVARGKGRHHGVRRAGRARRGRLHGRHR